MSSKSSSEQFENTKKRALVHAAMLLTIYNRIDSE